MATTVPGVRRAGANASPGPLQALVKWVVDLVGARELIANLVRRDLKVRHRGTFLGMLWSLTTPLLIVGLYYFVFTFILRQTLVDDLDRPDGQKVPFAIYFFCGLTVWNLFSTSVGAATGSVTEAGYLLNKVYFPRAILPLTTVLSSLVTFGFELAALMVASVVVLGPPSPYLLWAPVIVAIVVVFASGMALLLSAITVFLRDTAHFIAVFMQLWFWGTPVIYSLGIIKDRPGIELLLKLNPLTGAVVSFRNVVVLDHGPSFKLLAYDATVAVATLLFGAWIFQRWQRVFSEMV